MTVPTITINSVSKQKISDEPGMDESIVKFESNQTLKAWVAKLGGYSHSTGTVVGQDNNIYPSSLLYPKTSLYPQNYTLSSGVEEEFTVENEEITDGDGTYRINVYGMNEDEEWTSYG